LWLHFNLIFLGFRPFATNEIEQLSSGPLTASFEIQDVK
jgi:hypothetical protein